MTKLMGPDGKMEPVSTEDALRLILTEFVREKYGARLPAKRPSNRVLGQIAKELSDDFARISARAIETVIHQNVHREKGH